MGSKGFVMYDDYWQHLELLGDVEKGHLLQAIYAHRGMCQAPVLSAGEKMAFSFIRAQLDRDEDRYILKCETNRANVLKRWGREDTGECGRIPGDTNNTHTDTNTDTDTDKKMDKSGGKAQASPQVWQDGTGPGSLGPPGTGDGFTGGGAAGGPAGAGPPCGVDALATGYTTDPHLMEALGAFVAMRREMEKKSHGKTPFTVRALRNILAKLDRLAQGCRDRDRYKTECLDQSTTNGWRDVFALKDFEDAPAEAVFTELDAGLDRPRDMEEVASWRQLISGG